MEQDQYQCVLRKKGAAKIRNISSIRKVISSPMGIETIHKTMKYNIIVDS